MESYENSEYQKKKKMVGKAPGSGVDAGGGKL